MRMPTPKSMPAFDHQVTWCNTGSTTGFVSAPWVTRLRPNAARPDDLPPVADSTRSIHW